MPENPLTAEQMELLVKQLQYLIDKGFGEVTIRVWRGHLDMITVSESIKLHRPSDDIDC